MKSVTVIRRLLGLLGRQKYRLAGVLLSAVAGNAALLWAPRLIGDAIDLIPAGIAAGHFGGLVKLLALIGGLYAAGALLGWLTAVLANAAANRTVRDLRTGLFDKLGRLPVGYFDRQSRGDMLSRFTNDIDAVADGFNQGITQLASGVITVVFSLIFMLTLNPWVTLVVALVTPLCFLVGFFITKYGSRRFTEQSRILGKLNGYAEEIISGQRTVAAFGYEERAERRFGELNRELYEAGYRAQFASALVNPTTRFVNNIAYVLVGVFGLLAGLSAGRIASFLTYTAQFSKPFNEITAITMQIQLAIASARRIFAVMDEPEQPADDGAAELGDVRGDIAFDDVSFSYQKDRPLIRGFNLDVPAGKTVAIVGPTGAGKTTLINLLMRFYELDGGAIAVDGQDITAVTRDSLHRSFGMVLQETWLFAGSVRDNIAYGCPEATGEQVEAAARAAHAHGFIRRMADGYGTRITEDGGNLSAGQKQLLTIARAMLLDPPMLILDEATSAVDILTEQRIQRAFRKLMQGRTTFIIAHRLSTIRDADHILVLDQGDVVEQGTHEALLSQRGFYHRLYHSQFAPAAGRDTSRD